MQITVSSGAKGKMQILVRVSSVVLIVSFSFVSKAKVVLDIFKKKHSVDDEQNSMSDMFPVSTVVY